jgi:D-alanyl-D-alanine carboxypeptidase
MIPASLIPGRRLFRAAMVTILSLGLSAATVTVAQAQAQTQPSAPKSKVKQAAAKPVAKVAPRAQKVQQAVAKAPTSTLPRKSERYASLILDTETGSVLHDTSAYETRHPASLTKVMTLYMTFEAIEQGRLRMDQRVPVSGWASVQSPTKLDLKEGDTVPVRDLILGLITKSANDASVVLAEAIAGDEDVFAQRMTQRAIQLGMTATTFRNASGLPNDQQVTSAHDMAVMALAVMRDFPTYYPLFSTQEFSYAGRVHTNHNRMLGWYGGAEGLKTGYTNASGFNLIMIAKRDGRRLVGVVMGGDSAQSRDNHMAELMDKGFGSTGTLAGNGRIIKASAKPANAGSTLTPLARVGNAPPAPMLPPSFNDLTPAKQGMASNKLPPNPFAVASAKQTPQGGEPTAVAMQIGAYSDADAARRAVTLARFSLPDLGGNGSIAPVERNGRTLYRARILGLGEDQAAVGCRRLAQANILDCSVVRVEADDVDMAAN